MNIEHFSSVTYKLCRWLQGSFEKPPENRERRRWRGISARRRRPRERWPAAKFRERRVGEATRIGRFDRSTLIVDLKRSTVDRRHRRHWFLQHLRLLRLRPRDLPRPRSRVKNLNNPPNKNLNCINPAINPLHIFYQAFEWVFCTIFNKKKNYNSLFCFLWN